MTHLAVPYTQREVAFLRLAALMSGYFLRRQFNEFIGKECGAIAQRFVERGLARADFKALPTRPVIYHVAASPLYAALGDPDNRNRRVHEIDTVRCRLMALDYALATRPARWLLTEHEKIEHFNSCGVSNNLLPSSCFGTTRRYFPLRHPIAISQAGAVEFGFIDEGHRAHSSWARFLKAHRGLLQGLPTAHVVFATCDEHRFASASTIFRRQVAGEDPAGSVDVERLARHFDARRLIDEKQFQEFDQTRLDELREDGRVFSGTRFDQLYRDWREVGDRALDGASQLPVSLRLHLLPYHYDWLSPVRSFERRA